MSTQALNLQAPITQGQGTYFSIVSGEWRNRIFHLLKTGQGVNMMYCPLIFALGYGSALLFAKVIERKFPDEGTYHREFFEAKLLMLAVVGVHLFMLACGVHFTVVALVTSAALGFVISSKRESQRFERREARFCPTAEIINKSRGYTGLHTLNTLDLTDNKLTDQQLQAMADEGKFKDIQRLFLCMNPGISAQGLLGVIGKGCPQLVWLDVSCNHQLGRDLKKWVTPEGFSGLKVLEVRDINLTKENLEYMIEQPWVQRLEGINLEWNKTLDFPPKNVLSLTNLQVNVLDKGVQVGGVDAFEGKGICIDNLWLSNRVQKKECVGLLKAGKLHYRTR